MGDLIFFIKTVILTFVVVTLMQIKIGQGTLEQHALVWVESSPMVQPMRGVAKGAVKLVQNTWYAFTGNIKSQVWDRFDSSNQPGQRELGLKLERSKEYLKEQAEKAKDKVKDNYPEWQKEIREWRNQKSEKPKDDERG